MAVEDAAALGVFMSGLSSSEDVNARLQLFQELRHDRVCAMQILSSWGVLGYPKVFERSKPYFNKETAPSQLFPVDVRGINMLTLILADRDELNVWCFNRDVRQEALDMLHAHSKSV